MHFKKIIFGFLFIVILTSIVKPMFLEENQAPEDEIFNLIKNTQVKELEIYLKNLERSSLDNIFDHQDRTPLQATVTLYNFNVRRPKGLLLKEIVKLLLDHGANLNSKLRRNYSPVELNVDLFTEILSQT